MSFTSVNDKNPPKITRKGQLRLASKSIEIAFIEVTHHHHSQAPVRSPGKKIESILKTSSILARAPSLLEISLFWVLPCSYLLIWPRVANGVYIVCGSLSLVFTEVIVEGIWMTMAFLINCSVLEEKRILRQRELIIVLFVSCINFSG